MCVASMAIHLLVVVNTINPILATDQSTTRTSFVPHQVDMTLLYLFSLR